MLVLASDWDETITAADTLALIAPADQAALFAQLSDAYIADLANVNVPPPPLPSPPTAPADAAHCDAVAARALDELLAHLEALDAVELRSQARVEASGLFAGLPHTALDARARDVTFRAGWPAVAAWLEAHVDCVAFHVISVGWSAHLIARALALPRIGAIAPTSITANEVEMRRDADGLCRGTGRLTKARSEPAGRSGVRVAADKRRALDALLPPPPPPPRAPGPGPTRNQTQSQGQYPGPNQAPDQGHAISVYAGDSLTDIEALLRVDVGLLLGRATRLARTLTALFPGCVYTPAQWADAGAPLSRCTQWAFWRAPGAGASADTGPGPCPGPGLGPGLGPGSHLEYAPVSDAEPQNEAVGAKAAQRPIKVFIHAHTWTDALPVLQQLLAMSNEH